MCSIANEVQLTGRLSGDIAVKQNEGIKGEDMQM